MEQWLVPTSVTVLPCASSILILAPHPDDEIFGCGGAIALYAKKACKIHVHILTDGAGYETDREDIKNIRQQESITALKLISKDKASISFGEHEDRKLLTSTGLFKEIQLLIEEHQPEIIFCPSPWEIHPDHRACARAIATLHMEKLVNVKNIMFYEIGNLLRCNTLLDITQVWNEKYEAMQIFLSQIKNQNYSRHIEGLNSYRTYNLPKEVLFSEAYFKLSANNFSDLNSIDQLWFKSVIDSATVFSEQLQMEILTLNKENNELLDAVKKIKHFNELILQKEFELKQEIFKLKNSSSWRITAPLRKIASFFRR